MLKLRPSCN